MGWFSSKPPWSVVRTETVVAEDGGSPFPDQAWLLRDRDQWLLLCAGDGEARSYARGPRRWTEADRFSLGARGSIAPPLEGPDGPVLCWERGPRDDARVVVSAWDIERGRFREPGVAHAAATGHLKGLRGTFLPDGTHVIAGASIDGEDFVLTGRPGETYARVDVEGGGEPLAFSSRGDELFIAWRGAFTCLRDGGVVAAGSLGERVCVTRAGLVVSARAEGYEGPDDEIRDPTVYVRSSNDFGRSWSPEVGVGRGVGGGRTFDLVALPSGRVLLSHLDDDRAGSSFSVSADGRSWARLPELSPTGYVGPGLCHVVESQAGLWAFDRIRVGRWRDGVSRGVHPLPVPSGAASPSVTAVREDGGRVLLLHHHRRSQLSSGPNRLEPPGLIAVSELVLEE